MVTLRMEQIYHPFAYMLWITCSCKFAIDFTSSLALMVQFSFVTHGDHRIALFLPSEHCLFLFPVTISSFSADLYLPNSFMTILLKRETFMSYLPISERAFSWNIMPHYSWREALSKARRTSWKAKNDIPRTQRVIVVFSSNLISINL